ncbi:hypothetical protein QDR37_06600 [Amnibacterium sp. CER49]|uniref:hypothetical protein n=1 Tax=Amnibacterium sp. CER49 TaxID=3039161 RepID=UPI002447BFCC|nr:hypothetical protein [Amnibacterium sp. CER49]MDH2443610.1 hypothetical protein [Amnibacterium sp. CER49]
MVSREKQIKRLKKDALKLWEDQQALFGRAGGVYTSALPHAQYLAQTKLGPTALGVYTDTLKPLAGKGATAGLAAGRVAASTAQDAVFGTVVPAVSSAAAAALTLASEASHRLKADDLAKAAGRAADTVTKATKAGHRSEAKAAVKIAAAAKTAKVAGKAAKGAAAAKRSGGVGAGGTVGILLGLVAVAGIGYAVWQTLRADDDLWVADDEPETTPTTDAPTA